MIGVKLIFEGFFMDIAAIVSSIRPADAAAGENALRRWQSIAKPLGGLGLLEAAVVRAAAAQGSAHVSFTPRAVIVMCADNGVVCEGVSQTGQEVTAAVTENMSRGAASVCRMANVAGAEVIPVDVGVAREIHGENVLQRNVRRGSANMAKGPAMLREEAVAAILAGYEIAGAQAARGVRLLATGEMGIGNTAAAAAVAAVLLNRPVSEVTGRGAGLSSEGLAHKIAVIERAVKINRPRAGDPIDVLHKVGGLDIAGLVGVFLGGAARRVPVLIDGAISAAAALIAARLCPAAQDYMIATHASEEPCGDMLLKELRLAPFIHAGMRLGEGTGAVAAMPLLDMALAVYSEMPTFEEIAIEAYRPLK